MHSNELKHHGVQGQKWGVKNGPPYPLSRQGITRSNYGKVMASKKNGGNKITKISSSRDLENANKIYDTLTKKEKFYVTADKRIPDRYVSEQEYSSKNNILIYSELLKVNDVPVAVVDAWRADKTAEISILTNRNERGKGYASEVVENMIEALNKNPDIEKILWGAHKNNKGSIELAKKYGFDMVIDDIDVDKEWVTLIKKLDKKGNSK